MPTDREDLYVKYRVFKEPEDVDEHPTPMQPCYTNRSGLLVIVDEVEVFVFVLKPDSDPHAVTALATYAAAIRDDKPQLAADLRLILENYR